MITPIPLVAAPHVSGNPSPGRGWLVQSRQYVRAAAFQQTLRELGWTEGHKVTIDYRWGADDANRYRTYAAELVALAPDVIVAGNGGTARALQRARAQIRSIHGNSAQANLSR
jgi:hypothetical protein